MTGNPRGTYGYARVESNVLRARNPGRSICIYGCMYLVTLCESLGLWAKEHGRTLVSGAEIPAKPGQLLGVAGPSQTVGHSRLAITI